MGNGNSTKWGIDAIVIVIACVLLNIAVSGCGVSAAQQDSHKQDDPGKQLLDLQWELQQLEVTQQSEVISGSRPDPKIEKRISEIKKEIHECTVNISLKQNGAEHVLVGTWVTSSVEDQKSSGIPKLDPAILEPLNQYNGSANSSRITPRLKIVFSNQSKFSVTYNFQKVRGVWKVRNIENRTVYLILARDDGTNDHLEIVFVSVGRMLIKKGFGIELQRANSANMSGIQLIRNQ